jgi:hypothetical protein
LVQALLLTLVQALVLAEGRQTRALLLAEARLSLTHTLACVRCGWLITQSSWTAVAFFRSHRSKHLKQQILLPAVPVQ